MIYGFMQMYSTHIGFSNIFNLLSLSKSMDNDILGKIHSQKKKKKYHTSIKARETGRTKE